MSPEDAVVALTVFGGGFWVLRPLVGAIAKRIGGETPARRVPEADDAVQSELQRLRDDVDQLAERLDFAERLLAQQRDMPRIERG